MKQPCRAMPAPISLLLAAVAISAAPATQPAELRLPSWGVTAPTPPGWNRTLEPQDSTAAQWVRVDHKNLTAGAILRLEVYPKSLPTPAAFADQIAAKTKTKVTGTSKSLGGLAAVDLAGDPPAAGLVKPTDLYLAAGRVTEHAGFYYGLYCFATPASAAQGISAFDALADGIRWSDPVSPADALAPRDPGYPTPFPLFDTGMVFTLPDPYRLSKKSGHQARYTTYDFAHQKLGGVADVTLAPLRGPDIESVESAITTAAPRLGLAAAPEWTKLPGNLPVAFTPPVPRTASDDGKPRGPEQFVVALVGRDKYALFVLESPADDSAPKYASVGESVAKSVRVSKAYSEAMKQPESDTKK